MKFQKNTFPISALLRNLSFHQKKIYKSLIHKEMLFIRKNKNKIIQNAQILYNQKKMNNSSIGYLKSTVNFSPLEQKHDEFVAAKCGPH